MATRALANGDPAPAEPLRVLAVVSQFKWQHIDYLHALAERFTLATVYAEVGHPGAVEEAIAEGLTLIPIPPSSAEPRAARAALGDVVEAFVPDAVHTLYYFNEQLTLLARELAPSALIVHECRDPLTTLSGQSAAHVRAERSALEASDGQVFVSAALRTYLERLHGLDLGPTSILLPHSFAARTIGPAAPKLSAEDGEIHLALVGTAMAERGDGRYYVDIIDRLTGLGFVVHSHFHELSPGGNHLYRKLARRNRRYRYHPTISYRGDTRLSALISRYDLMGVFHDLPASVNDESPTLAVCMPTKAVCGWFHGGIPVVCFPCYRGLVELIEAHGIGFVPQDWSELERLRHDRAAIAEATARSLAIRESFSNEWNARRLESFFRARLSSRSAGSRLAQVP